jgi:Ciliary basal body-associated, B9 protein
MSREVSPKAANNKSPTGGEGSSRNISFGAGSHFVVSINGAIEAAEFPEYDELYCRYFFDYGPDWQIITVSYNHLILKEYLYIPYIPARFLSFCKYTHRNQKTFAPLLIYVMFF